MRVGLRDRDEVIGGLFDGAIGLGFKVLSMLRAYWDAAVAVDPDAPDEARTMRFERAAEIAALFQDAGLEQIEEGTVQVSSTYDDFDQLWGGFIAGVGPAGAHLASLSGERRDQLRDELWRRIGGPGGPSAPPLAVPWRVARVEDGRSVCRPRFADISGEIL